MYPDDLRYSSEHEWVRADASDDASDDAGGEVTLGVTHYAQEQLGDIVYVSLPEVGEALTSGSSVGELESTKSVSDLYAPVSGTVVARNEALDAQPELVNSDPYGEGWLLRVRVDDGAELEGLMDAAAYQEQIAG